MSFPATSIVASLTVAALAITRFGAGLGGVHVPDDAAKPIDFDREVKPILAKHCVSCHGAEKQKGGLRFDRKASAIAGGDSGAAIVPGKIAESLIIKLVSADENDDRKMPPNGKRLSAEQITTLQKWIEQGAKWPDDGSVAANPADWWSFKPVRKTAANAGANAIDGYIQAKLREKGLAPSPQADRRTLIRRLHFDLVGLPPAPENVERFARDDSPDAYEKLIDRLLASPHHGERWARHWLDVVHFGETHGYDKDKPRPSAWPYRDYVIRALNADKPYDRFVQEQIAGDVLFPGTVDGIEALGFLSAGPWDFIGHVELPESKIDGKVARHLDRDDFVANTIGTFMGLTAHCAQCHNHKFDPITQEDYYRLQAVFAGIDRTERTYDADPKVGARRVELERKKKSAMEQAEKLRASARAKSGPALADIEKQLARSMQPAGAVKPPEYGYHSAIASSQETVKWVQVDLGASAKLEQVVLRPCHDEFNGIGAGFGFPVRFRVEISDDASFKTGVTVIVDETAKDLANPGITPYTAKAGGKSGRYIRVTATRLASRQNDFILAIAELEALDRAGKNLAAGKPVTALDSIEAPVRWRKTNLTDGLFPGPRLTPAEVAELTRKRDAMLTAALGEKGVTELAAATKEADDAGAEILKLPPQRSIYLGAVHTGSGNFVGTGSTGKPRAIHLLSRGDVTKPLREVGPGAIPAIPGINGRFALPPSQTEGERRAALARWLTDRNNPLTWRVMANRVWQYHFGRGLVDTPNDFGKMGQLPSHPELLDYLAAELREHQSLKKLHKLIVMSATYRQVSVSNNAGAKIDAGNQYLWRQNRRKLEAEAVRDSILAVAGKLDLTMGGPSFQDFVIEKPEHSPHYQYHLFDPEDAKAHRRAVYRFVVRSKQQPFMAALDCADPSLAVEKRNETLTPQQALALLNNKLAVAMASHFAARVEKLGATDAERVSAAMRLALAREPTAKERDALTSYAKEHGLPNACRVVLNLNEFVFVD